MDTLFAFLAGLLPPLIWLAFWTREDKHPEPRWLILACFVGGAVAVFCSAKGEEYVATFITNIQNRYIVWAGVEEFFKFAAVFAIALTSSSNDEPIDAMMYCITVALGFAALENSLFVVGKLSGGASLINSLIAGNMRFIGPTLLHTVSSAFIGFTYGSVFFHSKFTKFMAIFVGLAGAITLHASFNLSIINASSDDTLRSFAWVWVAVVILIILFEEIKSVRPHASSAVV